MAVLLTNYKKKKSFLKDFQMGKPIKVYTDDTFEKLEPDGRVAVGGPHAPEDLRWYAIVEVHKGTVQYIIGD